MPVTDPHSTSNSLSNAELVAQIQAGTAPRVVDVRSGWEYRRGHVPGALHLPFARAFMHASTLPASSGETVVVYCEHGPRAWIAGFALRRAGFQVCYLQGHMAGWRKAGLPVESAGQK